jgi:hypothetical protein
VQHALRDPFALVLEKRPGFRAQHFLDIGKVHKGGRENLKCDNRGEKSTQYTKKAGKGKERREDGESED